MDIDQDKKNDQPTELSVQDFLNVGLDQVAYIRCSEPMDADVGNSEDVYVVYAADGSQISIMDSYDTAVAAIRINDLFPVTLH